MKRALKKRVKAVLKNTPNNDGVPVEQMNVQNPKTHHRARTQVAMIGLAISMGATSLLVTRQSDQAQAAAPVGSQKAASSVPAVSETDMKFAVTKLESPAVSSVSVPENPVIIQPTAVSPLPGLEAKWQISAKGMAVQVPVLETNSTSSHLQPQIKTEGEGQPSSTEENADSNSTAITVSAEDTGNVDTQLKAQQEFALNRLQEKSNRLRKSLAQLRSKETEKTSPTEIDLARPITVAKGSASLQTEKMIDSSQNQLISRLKESKEANAPILEQPLAPVPGIVVAQSTPRKTNYEVKPGDTLIAIANNHGISVSELVKVNNLTDPNQIKISQKLIIPTNQLQSSQIKTPNINWPIENQSNIKFNPPIVAESVVVPNNKIVTVPTVANTGIQANIPALTPESEIVTTDDDSSGIGGETPLPRALKENSLDENQGQKLVKGKSSDRLRSLQAEIERLREKYRTQQSSVTIPTVNQTYGAVPISIETSNAVAGTEQQSASQAIQIPVPKPLQPNYSNKTVPSLFRATSRPNEPINPEFLPNQGTSGWKNPNNTSNIMLVVPSAGRNSTDSLGKLRGTTVSPQLPPLAAVDRYLPKAVDETTNPSSTAYIWPAKGVLTSGYGWRWGRMHRGIDIANSTGTPIYAAADGVVEKAGWNKGGYGNLVDIRHDDGSLTRYAHNSRILVQAGQRVQQGQTIAAMGSTGFSTGPHSHFEVHRTGKGAINPIAFLPNRV
ncbi:peptidoglycan DD-metalloendopeptidase family protein [Cronbergia sp. UHCC 0137]|uniref:peptidoglycan DD-metalloendopeptidase family protein n=1 Tax=Cronbergia sp. UHCC 0137 TaxID=3110239 RepID=UPI002B1F57C1|nr:peptidoglycan DD-metalloendopeptidase family protein [Cronbergia sp. UHCC 0137]MEA5619538.1 peptidoglycan DD-metalloendopeptidase family protein [Cronbergia sp. UHCC 0137]